MKTIEDIVVEKSIKCRTFKVDEETIFINMVTPTRCISLITKLDQLDSLLQKPMFDLMILIKEIVAVNSSNSISITEDLYFVKDEIINNMFIGTLNNGQIMQDCMNNLEFDYIEVSTTQLKNLILQDIEEF